MAKGRKKSNKSSIKFAVKKNGYFNDRSKQNDSKQTKNAKRKNKVLSKTNIATINKATSEQCANNASSTEIILEVPHKKRNAKILVVSILVTALILFSILIPIIVISTSIQTPLELEFKGSSLSWQHVEKAEYYILDIDGVEYTTEENSFDTSTFIPNTYNVRICAVKGENVKSQFSAKYTFVIAKPMLDVHAVSGVVITKTYDGNNDFLDTLKIGEHYSITENLLKYGKDVDITMSNIEFDSPNVNEASKLNVSFSAVLKGESSLNYVISEGTFAIKAKILPKTIEVNPSAFVKQFADKDNLTDVVLDKELNENVNIRYTRKTGENIGFYDILAAISSNLNYVFTLDSDSGKNKFEIIQRVVYIQGAENTLVTKTYDGQAIINSKYFNSKIYTIENIVPGYEVDIAITEGVFNSPNVSDANLLTVNYSGILIDNNGVYKTLKSSFEVRGIIEPKTVKIIPNNFSKEFGNDEELTQNYYDSELEQNVLITFERVKGEAIGFYDIASCESGSSNYVLVMFDGSGKNKFEIEKRALSIQPMNIMLDKDYDGNVVFSDDIIKNLHYTIEGELDGYNVDIDILTAYYNNFNVTMATYITVEIDKSLISSNDVYKIDAKSFILSGCIKPKAVEVQPKAYAKQYGDANSIDFADIYYDEETEESISLTYIRAEGEMVGTYDFLAIIYNNSNYKLTLKNAQNKFVISKRILSITPTGAMVSKVFDNANSCNTAILKGTHYNIENTVNGEEPGIIFEAMFNSADIFASGIILKCSSFSNYADRYDFGNTSIVVPAQISKKLISIEPQYFSVQFGDVDYLKQSYNDDLLGLSFNVSFERLPGNVIGNYDIISAFSDNENYEFAVVNGTGKYQIAPRILGVEKIGSPIFSKIYDGTTTNYSPIKLGVHYNLTNLNGGSNATLNILTQEYNSKDVASATKVIVRYTAQLNGADASQFITVGGTMEFDAVITKRQTTFTPALFSKDYLTDIVLKQIVVDPISKERIEVEFETTAGSNHTQAECGIYDIIGVINLNTNHTITIENDAGVGKYIINRINLTISAINRSTVYNSLTQGISAPFSTPAKPLVVKYKHTLASEEVFANEEPINAGAYIARIIFEGDRNYLPQYVERNLVIERQASTITNTTPSNYVFDNSVKLVTATLNHSEAVIVYSRNNYINAGKYNYILVSVAQSLNYKAASISVSLNIAKQVVNNSDIAYPTASAITYGQHLYTSALIGGSSLGRFSWAEPNTLPVVADKKFLVSFKFLNTDDYDWSQVDLERYVPITINKAVISEIAFPTATGVVYTNTLATSSLIGTSIYGSFAWENSALIPSSSGFYNVIFIPYDENNYDFKSIAKVRQVYVDVSYRTYFQTNGGSKIAPMVVQQIFTEPFTFREGYVFDGWYLDETLLNKASFPLIVTKDTTLFASWYSEGLTFVLRDGSYSVMLDFLTIKQNIFIPSMFRNLPVTAIENNGFRNCTALEMIIIPKSIVSIGHNAFAGCTNLAFVQIVNGIESVSFGIDWVVTNYAYGTDVHFNAEDCLECDGTTDFHQPSCTNKPI